VSAASSCEKGLHGSALSVLLLLIVAVPLGGRLSLVNPTKAPDWQRWDEGLPSSAFVQTLAPVPEHPDTLYAGTYQPPGLWRSMDGGETWERETQAREYGPYHHPAFALLWDAGRQRWWAGTVDGLFFRAAASSAWQPVPELGNPVFSLALDADGRLHAVQMDAGLFRQQADGTWSCLRQEPKALAVSVSPDSQTVLLGTAGNGLWTSGDGGEKWFQLSDFQGKYVSTLLTDQWEGRWAYISTTERVYRSTDLGRTWQPVPELDERAYAFAQTRDGSLYVGLRGRVARSTDGGKTWTLGGEGLHPHMPVLEIITVGQPGRDSVLYAATGDGVYRSTDQGSTWQRHREGLGSIEVKALVKGSTGSVIAATPMGLYRRSPERGKWQLVDQAFRGTHFYDLAGDAASHILYAGMENGLVRSTDGGKTWTEVASELTPHGMPGVLVDPQDPDHVFIRLAFERVYESYDGGQTWKARWEGMETYHVVLSMARSPTGSLWAGTQDGLFRWEPQEERWQRVPLSILDQSVFAIAFDPAEKVQCIGTTLGLWCKSDRGRWHRRAAGVINHTVTALAVLPGGHLYAGTRYMGLYRSCDGGARWHRVSGVPADVTVNDLLADPEEMVVYVATDQGLFRGKDAACPQPAATSRVKGWEGLRIPTGLARLLSSARRYPPVRPLPAVHTLQADDASLRQAQEIGFQAIVQLFSWQEIEPSPGEWHWESSDFLRQATDFYGLDLVVRLDHPPGWALAEPSDNDGIPFDVGAYLRFVEAVARRYRGHIRGYIIWNEPNLAREWGALPDPASYTRLLQQAYVAIKRVDPFAWVVSAGLSPTNEQSDRALDDRVFLKAMYQAGARPFFNALGAHPYGFAYPPDDSHRAHGGLNMNRILDVRTVMRMYHDQAKPIWATEIGWTTHGVGEHAWLTVTPEEQADYLVRAWGKARDEFPWLHVFTVWNLSRKLPEGDEKAGYSLLYEDGTPKPACKALQTAFASAGVRSDTSNPWEVWSQFFPDPSPVLILARDEEVHLGDSQ